MSTLQVGQTLWFVPFRSYNGQPRELPVTKIGRKWGELENGRYRFDLQTLQVDCNGHSRPGVLYTDRAIWEAKEAADGAWRSFTTQFVRLRHRPPHLTADRIREAASLLGFDIHLRDGEKQ